jgi:N-acetylglucosaminyldiphosphoundecaprenol N-acetyl-beta-D-mannosaminyltransferase
MILGYNIFNSSLESIDLVNNKIINTINPHSYCVANKDLDFKQALKNSDILLPDGIGIVWAEKFLNDNSIKKIAGYDLFLFLMNKLNNESGSVFFLGASEETLEKIKSKSSQEYPNITLGSYSPPYKVEFSYKDSKIMCDEVNVFNPDVLFVGMTAPKQEKWVHLYKNKLNANIICSIGAVFDFYAGNVKRSPDIWISLGLEWLPRLIKEPRRLFYRNFVSTPKFILYVLSIKIFGQDNSK